MTPVYVSFFTPAYAREAEALGLTLWWAGVHYDIIAVPDLGSWRANCNYKPAFLLWMMDKYPGRALVWVDADARLRQKPTLFDSLADGPVDFACHYRRGELLSGTLYFGPTPTARTLLELWRRRCEANPEELDQRTLQAIVEDGDWLAFYPLPASYVRICDGDDMGDEIVIEQTQASRRLAGAVG